MNTRNNDIEQLEDVSLEYIVGGGNLLYQIKKNVLDYTTLYGTPIVSIGAIALHLTSRAYASKALKANNNGDICKSEKYKNVSKKLDNASLSCVGLIALNSVTTAACYLFDRD